MTTVSFQSQLHLVNNWWLPFWNCPEIVCLSKRKDKIDFIKKMGLLPPKIYALKDILYSLNAGVCIVPFNPLVKQIMLIIAKKIAAVEGDTMFFSKLSPTSQFANTWLPMKDADSKKVINQNVSLIESCLCPCCKERDTKTIITSNSAIQHMPMMLHRNSVP